MAGKYRPVSLTSVVSKCLEGILRDRILKYLEDNKLMSPRQFGFLPRSSTAMQLLEVMEKWSGSWESHDPVDVIYLDFQKAFDKVPHYRLLEKTKRLGVSQEVVDWLWDFLTGRVQRVFVNGSGSGEVAVVSGIPQGTVLGPLLFLLYVNDMPRIVRSDLLMFADDTKIFRPIRHPSDREVLQEDLNALYRWSDAWLLKFNQSKCKHMVVSRGESQGGVYFLDGAAIQTVHEEKDLGVLFDENLCFEGHIQSVVDKANRIVFLLFRTFTFDNIKLFPPLFTALVRSHLEYCIPVWCPCLESQKVELERVQRRATKRIRSLSHMSYRERLAELGLYSMLYRRRRGDMVLVYQLMHGYMREGIGPHLPRWEELAERHSPRAHSLTLFKQRAVTRVRRNFFSVRVVDDWNSLPEDVVTSPSLSAFKARLDRHWSNLWYNH